MPKRNSNQSGFSVVTGLLVLINILVIGFAGYYVYQKNNTSKVPLATSNQTVPQQKLLVIKEWGVQIPYSSADTLSATRNGPIDSNQMVIGSKQLGDAYGSVCGELGAGAISRVFGKGNVSVQARKTFGDGDYQTYDELYDLKPELSIFTAKVNDYYYYYLDSADYCNELQYTGSASKDTDSTQSKTASQAAIDSVYDFVRSIVPNTEPIPQ